MSDVPEDKSDECLLVRLRGCDERARERTRESEGVGDTNVVTPSQVVGLVFEHY